MQLLRYYLIHYIIKENQIQGGYMKKITVLALSILSLFIILSSSLSLKISAATTLETCYDSVCIISDERQDKSHIKTIGPDSRYASIAEEQRLNNQRYSDRYHRRPWP